jgi:DNA-binding PadR family transcriptional regulator
MSSKSNTLSPAMLHLLVALLDGEQHGYGLMRAVDVLSEGRVRLGPGTLYGGIKRLLEQGLVEESGERPDPALDDERRRYYRLSAVGKTVVREELGQLARLLKAGQRHGLARVQVSA